jgi:hypothetical protein
MTLDACCSSDASVSGLTTNTLAPARTRKRECDAVLGRLAQRPTTEPKVRGSNPLGRVEKALEISRLFVFSRNCWV